MDPPDDVDVSSEVAVRLADGDDALVAAVESALADRDRLVAVGVPSALLPSILAARERSSGEPWRIACRPGVVDTLGRAFVLGTAVAEAVENDEISLRTASGNDRIGDEKKDTDRNGEDRGRDADRTLFATPDRVDAVGGPAGDRTLVTEAVAADGGAGSDSTDGADAPGTASVDGVVRVAADRFEAATPASVDMPSRTRLLAAARERLDARFAEDVAAVLESLEYGAIGRVGDVTDQTLLVALAARHDHLFRDLRGWVGNGSDGMGIAPGQELTDDRRALVERELIESIKVPMGPGRPKFRLRAVDDALLRAKPEEVLSVLRGRFALPRDDDGTLRQAPGREGRRPVWQRDR